MRDYWLNKLFFDLQTPALAVQWRSKREPVLERYPLAPEIRAAVLADDIKTLAPRVNAYLLRFYMMHCGMSDAEAMQHLRQLEPNKEAQRG